jgi:hypothetical protein
VRLRRIRVRRGASAVVGVLTVLTLLVSLPAPVGASRVVGAGTVAPAAASAPFSLEENGISPAAVSLVWAESTAGGFDNYTVLDSTTGPTPPWSVAAVVTTQDAPTTVVSGLGPGIEYWWNVTAYSTSGGILGIGETTTETYSTILPQTQPTLADLTSPANSSTSIDLEWNNNASYGGGISFGYYAIEEVSSGGSTTVWTNYSETSMSATVGDLTPGSTYYFSVETADCIAACDGGSPSYSVTTSNVVRSGTATELGATISVTRPTVDVGLPDGFDCIPYGGDPPYTFGWNFTNGSTFASGSSATSFSFSEPAIPGYTVTCEVTDSATHKTTYTSLVLVNPRPVVSVVVSPVNATVGTTVTFRCTAAPGTDPLVVGWELGDGANIANRTGAYANGSASYGSPGTYVARCAATDALGVEAAASVVVHIRAAPPYAWLTAQLVLGLSVAVGAALVLAVLAFRRRNERADRSSAMARWLPPTGPATTVHGAKICPKCGISNVPLRRTCQACGTPLPRSPSQ